MGRHHRERHGAWRAVEALAAAHGLELQACVESTCTPMQARVLGLRYLAEPPLTVRGTACRLGKSPQATEILELRGLLRLLSGVMGDARTIRLPPDEHAALGRLARMCGLSVGTLIRIWVRTELRSLGLAPELPPHRGHRQFCMGLVPDSSTKSTRTTRTGHAGSGHSNSARPRKISPRMAFRAHRNSEMSVSVPVSPVSRIPTPRPAPA
jgi:hypothetical protein